MTLSKIKTLHVIPTLSPRYGGPAKVCLEIARRLDRAGHDAMIFTTNRDYPNGTMAVPTGAPVDHQGVPVTYFPVDVPGLLISRQMARALSRVIPNVDLVHIHGLYRFPLAAAAYYSQRFRVPYLVRPHGSLDPYLFHKRERRTLKRIYERLIEFPNLNRAALLHYTTQEEMSSADFLKLHSSGIVIPNGIEADEFSALPQRGRFRSKHGLGDKKIIMHLGRVTQVKGLDILAAAFADIVRRRDDVMLVIAGPDIDGYARVVRAKLQDLGVERNVVFTGMLVGDEKLAALRDADIFALPSYTENFGMAVVEAMAAGLPVVISNQVKIWREVQYGEAGLVTSCDAVEVGHALYSLLDDPVRRQCLGNAGRAVVTEKFHWDVVMSQLLAGYRTALTQHANLQQGLPISGPLDQLPSDEDLDRGGKFRANCR
jgi:glycosyltransferase involved in cell wall biosynthesis